MLFYLALLYATHMNALFSDNPFHMPPIFMELASVGGIFFSRIDFANAQLCWALWHFSGREACKSHPPFNLHTFRPLLFSPVSSSILATQLPLSAGFADRFCQIALNRAGRVPGGLFIHFFQTRAQIATRMATGGNRGLCLSPPAPCVTSPTL